MRWLSEFLGCAERPEQSEEAHISSDLALEIDYASCKRYGVSYRALPASYTQPKTSGRTELCDQVLNDTWVSFPSWSSEDTSNVTSKKSLYEEHIYKTEDERFELDIVIELNRAAIQSLEGLRRRLGNWEEAEAKTKTGELMGQPLTQRAIRRIYGERSVDIIDGLKRNPKVAVPLVLKRLKAKEEEWREAQKGFNRLWREQNDKYYLKSLDQQSLSFKQNDLKALKSKALLNQIEKHEVRMAVEVLYDERHEKGEESGQVSAGPHLTYTYPTRRSIVYDVTDLLIHHVKRQPSIQKEDKGRIKKFLKQTLPSLVGLSGEDLSDEEEETEEGEGEEEERRPRRKVRGEVAQSTGPVPSIARGNDSPTGSGYSLIFLNNSHYVFFRLHLILCERLAKLHDYASSLAVQSSKEASKPLSAAALLKALPKQSCEASEFYAALLGQVKNLLDGAVDNAQFEDTLREMFTTQAYQAFTMDKIVQTMVRQCEEWCVELSTMVSEGSGTSALSLWETWRSEGGAGGPGFVSARRQEKEEAYQAAAEALYADQNCFKIFFKEETGEMTVELVDTEEGEGEGREEWSQYVSNFVATASTSDKDTKAVLARLSDRPVLLYRTLKAGIRTFGHRPLHAEDAFSLDGLEMLWKAPRLKPKFVAFTGDVFYRRGALMRGGASLRHPTADKRRSDLNRWTENWKSSRDVDAEGTDRWLSEGTSIRTRPVPVLPPDAFPQLTATLYSSQS